MRLALQAQRARLCLGVLLLMAVPLLAQEPLPGGDTACEACRAAALAKYNAAVDAAARKRSEDLLDSFYLLVGDLAAAWNTYLRSLDRAEGDYAALVAAAEEVRALDRRRAADRLVDALREALALLVSGQINIPRYLALTSRAQGFYQLALAAAERDYEQTVREATLIEAMARLAALRLLDTERRNATRDYNNRNRRIQEEYDRKVRDAQKQYEDDLKKCEEECHGGVVK